MVAAESAVLIPLAELVEAPWNANRVPAGTLAKVRRSIERFGFVENLVARPHPTDAGKFEVVSGNHRLGICRELGIDPAPVVVAELNDAEARLLAQTLNRTRGTDDPVKYAQLLEDILTTVSAADAATVLPETEASIDRVLASLRPPDPDAATAPPREPRSRLGEVYELGEHRLMCGDSTDQAQVRELLAGAAVGLLATDPPYGVSLDHTWRDGKRQPLGSARSGVVANDDRAEWTEAYRHAEAPVAYVWHASHFGAVVQANLETVGYEIRQQIIWVKTTAALSRAAYHWQHEPCWYAVRRGAKANWLGGRKQTTVWEYPSPIAVFGRTGSAEDASTAHPTQKPIGVFERPILNHLEKGGVVYDPFAGSGSAVVAAEKTGRRACAMELDPAWCDVIRDRYESFVRGRTDE